MKKFINTALLLGLFVFIIGTTNVLAGTATASATAAGGEDCGKISQKKNQNTSAMTVGNVIRNGKPMTKGTDYHIKPGTDGSTRPVIIFTSPLNANDKIEVTLSTGKRGAFTVNLELTTGC
jgi:hypothetical protein